MFPSRHRGVAGTEQGVLGGMILDPKVGGRPGIGGA